MANDINADVQASIARMQAKQAPAPLSTGQQATKFFADMAPNLTSFAGGILGAGGGAAATPELFGTGAIPGWMAGSAIGRPVGSALQMAAYKAAGIPFDSSPGSIAKVLAANAGIGALEGGVGGALPLALGRVAAPIGMKMGIGNAELGAEQDALRQRAMPNQGFIDKMGTALETAKNHARALADALTQQGEKVSFDDLVLPLKQRLAKLGRSDLTGPTQSNAVADVLAHAKSVVGPKEVVTGGGAGFTAPSRVVQKIPAQPITPSHLQEINEIARQRLNDYFEARQGVKGAGVAPDPSEAAWKDLWLRSKQLLEGMGVEGKKIGQLNEDMRGMYVAQSSAKAAAKRSLGGAFGINLVPPSVPMGAANVLNSPAVKIAAGAAPRVAGAMVPQGKPRPKE